MLLFWVVWNHRVEQREHLVRECEVSWPSFWQKGFHYHLLLVMAMGQVLLRPKLLQLRVPFASWNHDNTLQERQWNNMQLTWQTTIVLVQTPPFLEQVVPALVQAPKKRRMSHTRWMTKITKRQIVSHIPLSSGSRQLSRLAETLVYPRRQTRQPPVAPPMPDNTIMSSLCIVTTTENLNPLVHFGAF